VSARLVTTLAGLDAALDTARRSGAAIGLVPTMGALHAGHGSLLEQARRECRVVVASVFVNPIQFNQAEDYQRYPRDVDADLRFCGERGVDFVFAPAIEEMYRRPQRAFVDVEGLADHLCGRFRPGHFRGVATVVMKLFQIVRPGRAYFGEKDFQQLAVIRRMAADLNVPVTIVGVPTVREPDGLAMSSRNRHLSPAGRASAIVLYRALCAAATAIAEGETSAGKVQAAAAAVLAGEPSVRLEYLEIVDPEEIQPVAEVRGPVRIAAAAWVGSTRLIDNLPAAPTRTSTP
jgi:pantoate--beta-alanine ligase